MDKLGLLDMVEWRQSLESLKLMIEETSRNDMPPSVISIISHLDILNSEQLESFMRMNTPAFTKRAQRRRKTICSGAGKLESKLFLKFEEIEEGR